MSESTNGHLTKGAHHVGLTVTNLDEARRFFVEHGSFTAAARSNDLQVV